MEVVCCMHHTIISKYFKLLTNVLFSQVNTCIFFLFRVTMNVYTGVKGLLSFPTNIHF
jgi:hypothetical protein